MQQEDVEGVDPEALEAALGRHADVAGVLVGAAQRRVGEAWEALRAVALGGVEVVSDRADDAVVLAVDGGDRPAEQEVRLARPVGVGCEQRVEPVAGTQQGFEALLGDRLAEMQVAPTAPRSDCGMGGPGHRHRVRGRGGCGRWR